ncbi:MAG: hypothetical protein ABI142_09440 [Bryocella sp.]
MASHASRRNFLRSAPLAVAAAVVPASTRLSFAEATTKQPFEQITSENLSDAISKLQAAPGNHDLYASPSLPFTIVLTVEKQKSAKEFEWHEHRDHIFEVLEGTTRYELGGTPKGARNTKPSEWLAPSSEGTTTFTLHKGDRLIIPRNTPHKRSTESSVTFILISTTGDAAA